MSELTENNIIDNLKTYLIANFYQGPLEQLTPELPLITSGIIDSISTLQVVEYIESTFKFDFAPHEVDHKNLDSIDKMVNFIMKKKAV